MGSESKLEGGRELLILGVIIGSYKILNFFKKIILSLYLNTSHLFPFPFLSFVSSFSSWWDYKQIWSTQAERENLPLFSRVYCKTESKGKLGVQYHQNLFVPIIISACLEIRNTCTLPTERPENNLQVGSKQSIKNGTASASGILWKLSSCSECRNDDRGIAWEWYRMGCMEVAPDWRSCHAI